MERLSRKLAKDLDGSFPELVRAFEDGIYSGTRRLAGDAAEDVTQETFLRAYRALSRMTPSQIGRLRLKGWMWTIALNLCRNRARSAKRKPTVRLSPEWAPPSPGHEDDAVAAATWDRRLAGLSTAQRTAVVLKHVVGLSYPEMSEVMDRPVGTLKADVARGLDRLRSMIEKEEA
jgi:RNA polymerase sigma-70 factor (ECF subfamily)